MENDGWISLHRKIMDNKYWLSEPFTRAQAWVDLLLLANHKPGQIRKRGILIDVNRGQVGFSEESLAARWRWSRGKVLRFLSELKTGQQIERVPVQQNPKLSSLISIINYDFYQSGDTTKEQKAEQQTVQQTDIKRYRNNNDNKEKKEYMSDSDFNIFYQAYPRHVAKKKALDAWKRIERAEGLFEKIMSALDQQKQLDGWKKDNGKYVPHPATWLNSRRWEDEVPEVKPSW